jgi:hypothetical protein
MNSIHVRLLIAAFFVLSNVLISHSQETANVAKVEEFLNEIYRDCPLYRDSTHIEIGKDCLKRTLYHRVSIDQYPECPLLSSVHHKNKCNQELSYELTNFDPLTFNPLKYQFFYYSPNTAFFRVDGTEYIIEIKPGK